MFTNEYVNGEIVNIKTEFGFSYSNDISSILCISKISYYQDNRLLLLLELACTFDIAQEGQNALKKEKKIDAAFQQYMATIVVGTARGIIHSKTEGSVLNPIVLPPINLVKFINKDIPISEQEAKQ